MQQVTVTCFGCLLLSLCPAAEARVDYLSDHTSNGACEVYDGFSAFNGTIWEQLTPWLGGITRQHLEGAADLVRDAYGVSRFGQQFDVPGNISGFYGTIKPRLELLLHLHRAKQLKYLASIRSGFCVPSEAVQLGTISDCREVQQ